MAPINFMLHRGRNYAGVQQQILGEIQQHLRSDQYTESDHEWRPGTLNFCIFRYMPGDVCMSHGAADKDYFLRHHGDKRIADYFLHIFVPGPWLKERIVNHQEISLGENQVHVVGWPRLDTLLAMQERYKADPARAAASQRRKKILWAPTHDYARRGADNIPISSYPRFLEHIETLGSEFDVEVSLHPRNRPDKKPTAEKLIEADYVIADNGTLVYEAWCLGKPVVFPSWLLADTMKIYRRNSAEAMIYRDKIGYHPASFEEMMEILRDNPVIDRRTREFLDSYMAPEYHGKSAKRVADLLIELAQDKKSLRASAPVRPPKYEKPAVPSTASVQPGQAGPAAVAGKPLKGPNDMSAEAIMALLPVVNAPKIFRGAGKYKKFKYISLHRVAYDIVLPGDFAEFGVFRGDCARYITELVRGDRKLHLFDSFEGLPSDWRGRFKKGTFDLGGKVPDFDPERTRVYKGWFKDTVPEFAKSLTRPLAFIHADADLYQSTMDFLLPLNDRIAPGTVILFDEYFIRNTDEEHRALVDWARKFNREFEYLWRTKWAQVAVRITK